MGSKFANGSARLEHNMVDVIKRLMIRAHIANSNQLPTLAHPADSINVSYVRNH